jgi:hypothetical protein
MVEDCSKPVWGQLGKTPFKQELESTPTVLICDALTLQSLVVEDN